MADAAPRVGLVLGAGGVAGGAFHSGVLAALEESTGWDPRDATVIVGTSAGSITAAGLRAGLSAGDGLARAQGRTMSADGVRLMSRVGHPRRASLRPAPQARRPVDIAAAVARAASRPFTVRPWTMLAGLLPEGSLSTEFISNAVNELLPGDWPEEPMWICAVRQRDGRRTVFGHKGVTAQPAEAVAASCAIPGFFSPVEVDGQTYVDGGLHSPTNADLLADKSLGLDLVIVSSPMSISGRSLRATGMSPVRRWAGTLLDTEVLRLRARGIPVVAFQPTEADVALMGPNAMDPTKRAAIATHARMSTERRLSRPDSQARLAVLRRVS